MSQTECMLKRDVSLPEQHLMGKTVTHQTCRQERCPGGLKSALLEHMVIKDKMLEYWRSMTDPYVTRDYTLEGRGLLREVSR